MILQNEEVLKEEWVPDDFQHRDRELNTLANILKPILKSQEPRDMFLFGPPGAGKTSLTAFVLRQLKERARNFDTAYVNCWIDYSKFKVLQTIVQELGRRLIQTKSTGELLEIIRSSATKTPLVLILDEVDQLEDETILYELLRSINISLIMIANDRSIFEDMDPRIASSLSFTEFVPFEPYENEELSQILSERARLSLLPNTISQPTIEKIARFSRGDARTAINLLRIAALKSEEEGFSHVRDDFIAKSLPIAVKAIRQKDTSRLNPHQQMILEILKEHGELRAEELHKKYEEKIGKPVVKRTLRKYLNKLTHYRLVQKYGESRGRVYKAA